MQTIKLSYVMLLRKMKWNTRCGLLFIERENILIDLEEKGGKIERTSKRRKNREREKKFEERLVYI